MKDIYVLTGYVSASGGHGEAHQRYVTLARPVDIWKDGEEPYPAFEDIEDAKAFVKTNNLYATITKLEIG